MDEFANILHRDYGFKPQGKSAPMTGSKSAGPSPFSASSNPSSIQRTSSGGKPKNGSNRNSRNSTPILGESLDEDFFFGSLNGINSSSPVRNTFGSAPTDMPVMYDDVFGGPPKFAAPSYSSMPSSATQQTSSSQSYDDIFRIPVKPSSSTSFSSNKGSSFPVFDAPVYDDDIFGGVPGIRNASVVYDDVFSGASTVGTSPSVLEDLLGVSENRDKSLGSQQPVFDSPTPSAGVSDFDDLIPGFGGTEPAKPLSTGDRKRSHYNSSGLEKDSHGMASSDPFDVLQGNDPFSVPQPPDQPSASPFSDSDASNVPAQSSDSHRRRYSNSDFDENIDASGNGSPPISTGQSPVGEPNHPAESENTSLNSTQIYNTVLEENHSKRNQTSSLQANDQTRSSSSPKPQYGENTDLPSFHSPTRHSRQMYDNVDDSVHMPKVVENRQADEFWISVEDVKLVTEPTTAPPPSRRPPLPGSKHGHMTRRAIGSKTESNQRPSSRHDSPRSAKQSSSRGTSEQSNRSNLNDVGNSYNELDEFASGVSRARKETKMDMSSPTLEEEIMEGSAAAAASAMAMKEAMERARSKLRDRAKDERESGLKVEETLEGLNKAKEDEDEKARELEEKERAREREARENEAKALREREEREKRRREREEMERKREREKDRIAVERATQEARERAERIAVERANAEVRERAAAEARQRAAVERVTAEARERAAAEAREKAAAEARERAAVERVTAEARERAAAEARERAAAEARERAAAEAWEKGAAEAREKAAAEKAAVERAAAEARERAAAEAREKAAAERAANEARARAERAFVERVNAEARERAAEKAAAEARERAEKAAAERASAAREQQRRSENDLEAFFASNSRPGSVPRQRSPAKSTSSQPSKGFTTEGSQRSSTAAPAVKKATPASSADDWTSLFGPAVSGAGEFQELDGESVERRRARLDRHQRTAERAAKALDEKNQRDLQAQREQAERHRAGEMLDAEIKRWAAGKEGNLRALLSTLQYVLWPECGWQAVSLTDLITAAAVKKVYRKATLCVHPDKVQQKGATIQQKYIAEKVFDLLKEAWNKFNSEELF